jgi:hypothetical protein
VDCLKNLLVHVGSERGSRKRFQSDLHDWVFNCSSLAARTAAGAPSSLPIRVVSDPGAQLRTIDILARAAERRFEEAEKHEYELAAANGELNDVEDDADAAVGDKRKSKAGAAAAKRRRNALAHAAAVGADTLAAGGASVDGAQVCIVLCD